jgi:Alr-MurF fusion protein
LKLGLSHQQLCEIIEGTMLHRASGIIDIVIYDTRKISTNRKGVFFALSGNNKDGHEFCANAYDKGVRCFVVTKPIDLPDDACVIQVQNVLYALQVLAAHHRGLLSIPVIAITGSLGKTTIKEWLYFLLKDDFKVGRTPKSYNSQLGVALALLELNETHEIALIEADISHPGEMDRLEEIIAPTLGVFSGIGKHYVQNFRSRDHHLDEHLRLFKNTNFTFIEETYHSPLRRRKIAAIETQVNEWKSFGIAALSFPDSRAICLKVAEFLGVEKTILQEKIQSLPTLSGRREVFEGVNSNLIINDTYNIDIDALEQALEYLMSSKERSKKVVVLDLSFIDDGYKSEVLQLTARYKPHQIFVIENDMLPNELLQMRDAAILFKGSFRSNLKSLVQKFKNRKHETWVEFDLKAIVNNLRFLQSLYPKETKTLVMVKASSYGTGDVKIPHFLQENGVDYLGVAYTDEGATLRENGIELPVMVMNTERNAFEDIVLHQLEPALYSTEQLEQFIETLEHLGQNNYPIHLKLETGMQRLGFSTESLPEALAIINRSDTVTIKSVYSHLADADNEDGEFSQQQIAQFRAMQSIILKEMPEDKEDILFHLLNSEGVLNYGSEAAFDMVRLGIGIFGYATTTDQLQPSLKWMTTVSQIKQIEPGDSVGYGRAFIADHPLTIATIRVGYADGFRRSLSQGKGQVFINNRACPVIGNVCMDMTMIDISHIQDVQPGDLVEIIGPNQSLVVFAQAMDTIPYEVMTSINKRVARVYVE